MATQNPLEYLQHLSQGKPPIIYKNDDVEIHFRSVLNVADIKLLPPGFLQKAQEDPMGVALQMFKLLAVSPVNGLPLFPIRPGIEHEAANQQVDAMFDSLDAFELARIANDIDLFTKVLPHKPCLLYTSPSPRD